MLLQMQVDFAGGIEREPWEFNLECKSGYKLIP